MPAWLIQNSQMIFFLAQLAYWFFMVVFFGYAVAQFKRWVNFQLGTGHSGQLSAAEGARAEKAEVNVDEFVE